MKNILWNEELESQLKTVPIFGDPRARKRMWENVVLGNTLEDGDIFEFGVASGGSIFWFPKHFKDTKVYGFDSFEGLPEDWNLGETILRKGHFSTNGTPPKSTFENVHFIKGWFEDSLPTFLKNYNNFIKILHFDCDLYSSTKFVLTNILPYLRVGTVILFDELTHFENHPQYHLNREHEYKAFTEFCQANPTFQFKVLGRTSICQVAIKITSL